MVLKGVLLIFGILFSIFCFAENVDAPCNHSDSDSAKKIEAKQRIDNMFREIASVESKNSQSLDGSSDNGGED